ncbi:MAG TPA: ATP-dependent metallopeptidase FtsH/Yme1/Tma family protein [Rhodoferax sp.]|nr:ATP-dependent metallopeptidase FtsH/Yme1/Tma family protein [Rhodoferax sp.]
MDKKQTWNVGYWLLAAVLLLWLQGIWQSASQSEVVPDSAFEQALSEGRIVDVTVTDLTMTGRHPRPGP